jgi:hypothetical protein
MNMMVAFPALVAIGGFDRLLPEYRLCENSHILIIASAIILIIPALLIFPLFFGLNGTDK